MPKCFWCGIKSADPHERCPKCEMKMCMGVVVTESTNVNGNAKHTGKWTVLPEHVAMMVFEGFTRQDNDMFIALEPKVWALFAENMGEEVINGIHTAFASVDGVVDSFLEGGYDVNTGDQLCN